jgi:hypothetical protein
MATNKNQHFVPRCYLRPFTLNAGDAAINVFNLDRKRFIPDAPVKNQCSRDYFYGKDEQLEQAIQLVESGYGSTLRKTIEDHRLLTPDAKTVFGTFWLFQHLRTEAAAKRAIEMSESTRTLADLPPGEFSIGIKEAVQIAMRAFVSSMDVIDDLKFCLLKNKTDIPFITSDNPAVLTNKWHLESSRTRGLSFGLESAGVLAILPLTPYLLLLGYDGDVYSVPHEGGIIHVKSERDVIALNQHQFLQCSANVYVQDASHAETVQKHYAQVESIRPKSRHMVHYAEFEKTVGEHSRYVVVSPENRDKTKEAIMHSQVIHPRPTSWPSQIRMRTKGSVYTNGTGRGYVRYACAIAPSRVAFWRERV